MCIPFPGETCIIRTYITSWHIINGINSRIIFGILTSAAIALSYALGRAYFPRDLSATMKRASVLRSPEYYFVRSADVCLRSTRFIANEARKVSARVRSFVRAFARSKKPLPYARPRLIKRANFRARSFEAGPIPRKQRPTV